MEGLAGCSTGNCCPTGALPKRMPVPRVPTVAWRAHHALFQTDIPPSRLPRARLQGRDSPRTTGLFVGNAVTQHRCDAPRRIRQAGAGSQWSHVATQVIAHSSWSSPAFCNDVSCWTVRLAGRSALEVNFSCSGRAADGTLSQRCMYACTPTTLDIAVERDRPGDMMLPRVGLFLQWQMTDHP